MSPVVVVWKNVALCSSSSSSLWIVRAGIVAGVAGQKLLTKWTKLALQMMTIFLDKANEYKNNAGGSNADN